jgi:probable rRNA maturation factor
VTRLAILSPNVAACQKVSAPRNANQPLQPLGLARQEKTRSFFIKNRQRQLLIDVRLLRQIGRTLLRDLLDRDNFDLGLYIVQAPAMRRLNETFLRHQGSTDVITFAYRDPARPNLLYGELFVCINEAVAQARRFRTTWQSELVRYLVHGLLHLTGYDDRHPALYGEMKREEDRLLRELRGRFFFRKLAGVRTFSGLEHSQRQRRLKG